ncbi:unnamed protein product [Toxocara canis]|uniref:Uncharacterized protein n=1 Tax=Toxocara canis TaxID=6265 RepID=A0A183V3H1_TOXCA|nr:unnamed protein product [Toxocara canis]
MLFGSHIKTLLAYQEKKTGDHFRPSFDAHLNWQTIIFKSNTLTSHHSVADTSHFIALQLHESKEFVITAIETALSDDLPGSDAAICLKNTYAMGGQPGRTTSYQIGHPSVSIEINFWNAVDISYFMTVQSRLPSFNRRSKTALSRTPGDCAHKSFARIATHSLMSIPVPSASPTNTRLHLDYAGPVNGRNVLVVVDFLSD